jgi:hypothetical protein
MGGMGSGPWYVLMVNAWRGTFRDNECGKKDIDIRTKRSIHLAVMCTQSMTKLTKYYLGKLLAIIGIALLCLSLIGDLTHIGGYKNNNPRSWERFDLSLVHRTHSIDDLILEARSSESAYESLSDEQKMVAIFNVVADRFAHNAGARHTPFTNWILYFAGKFHPTFGAIWDPEIFVEKGHSLICSQSSYLLMQMAFREGIKARHVGLNGHVVMEAWYNDDWHLFDPDAEVIPRDEEGIVLSVEELSNNTEILKKEYPLKKGDFVPIISSREDNSFVSYPEGAYFEWKSQVLFYLEKLMQIFKYLVPVLLFVLGVFMQRKNRINSDR